MTDNFEHITDLESVRLRPGMYFRLESSLVANCMAREAYCLAIDQIAAGLCTRLTSLLDSDGYLTVDHNGQSLGIEPAVGFGGFSEMLAVVEFLAACADRAASEYVNSHVCKNGMTALAACCERFELNNFHDNAHYRLCYDSGKRVGDVETVGECNRIGVMIRFKPDATIIPTVEFDLDELQRWFATAPINESQVEVVWRDNREKPS